MNILQIVSGRVVNGALIYCKLLSRQLRKMGHNVTVLTRGDSWLNESLESEGIPCLTSPLTRFPLGEVNRIRDWCSANQIDLIHTHMSRAHSFGVLLKLASRIPVVATAHSRSLQLHWRLNDFVIANSNSTAEYQTKFNRVPKSKLETIHCFVDLQKFREVTERDVRRVQRQLRLNGDEFLVGVVGDVCERKGHRFLFQALSRVVKQVPNLRLVLLGRFHRREAYTRQLRQRLIEERLFRYTKWLGLRFNVADFMTAFDVCVVPSIEEPLGMVAIESMAAGTPVIASQVGGLPEIVKQNVNGILVPPRDPQAIAEALIAMAMDRQLRNRMGATGQAQVFHQFDPVRLTGQVIDVYEKAIGKNSRIAA